MDERIPETQPSGALVPPPRVPPVAVAASAPQPPRPVHRRAALRGGVGALVDIAFDGLDELGDRIAHLTGLR